MPDDLRFCRSFGGALTDSVRPSVRPFLRATWRSGHTTCTTEDDRAAAAAAIDRKVSRHSRLSSGYEVVTAPFALSLALSLSRSRWLISLSLVS